VQDPLDQHFSLGAGNEDSGPHFDVDVAERYESEDVLQRFASEPSLHQPLEAFGLRRRQILLTEQDLSTIPQAERMCGQVFRFPAWVVRTDGAEPLRSVVDPAPELGGTIHETRRPRRPRGAPPSPPA
jgi:hypothetical protein